MGKKSLIIETFTRRMNWCLRSLSACYHNVANCVGIGFFVISDFALITCM